MREDSSAAYLVRLPRRSDSTVFFGRQLRAKEKAPQMRRLAISADRHHRDLPSKGKHKSGDGGLLKVLVEAFLDALLRGGRNGQGRVTQRDHHRLRGVVQVGLTWPDGVDDLVVLVQLVEPGTILVVD